MEYNIFYPTPLSEIEPEDDNLDVCVTFADGQNCTFVLATPRNLVTQMEQQGRGYLEPGLPVLIVETLTDENIRACIDAISDDQAMKRIYGTEI